MTVASLDQEHIRDLTAPLGLDATETITDVLAQRVELATRRLTEFFMEAPLEEEERYDKEYRSELELVAADPARALDQEPNTEGGKGARIFLNSLVETRSIDADTRRGAVAIGDLAVKLLKRKPATRIDAQFRMGIDQLFDDIVETLGQIAPTALERWPSNDAADDIEPSATTFAMAFIQITVDRMQERLPNPSPRAQRKLNELLGKNHRHLLGEMRTGGLRKARRWREMTDEWFEGEITTMVL